MVITNIVLYVIIIICAIIIVLEGLAYNYYTHPVSTLPGETLTQYLTMLFKWFAIAAICVILLKITATTKTLRPRPLSRTYKVHR